MITNAKMSCIAVYVTKSPKMMWLDNKTYFVHLLLCV